MGIGVADRGVQFDHRRQRLAVDIIDLGVKVEAVDVADHDPAPMLPFWHTSALEPVLHRHLYCKFVIKHKPCLELAHIVTIYDK